MVGRRDLPNAVALNSSLFNAARIFGPALGGVIIAAAGVGFCFALNAVSYVAVLAGLLAMRVADLYPVERGEHPPLLQGVREGLGYARRSPRVRLTLVLVLALSTFCFNFNVLLPVLAKQTLQGGPQVLGVLSACFGAGALLGALLSASLGRASLKVLLLGTGGFGLFQLLLAPERSVVVCAALLFATGLSFTLWTSNSNSYLQLGAPDRLRGRVVGLYYYSFNGAGPLGGLMAGWLSARGGTPLAFLVSGLIGVAMTVVAALQLRSERPAAAIPVREEPEPERLVA
jgi:MFS family permease